MVQQQQGRANTVTTTSAALPASTWSNDFDISSSQQNSTGIYSYYRVDVEALASDAAISSVATRATPPTTRTAALPPRLHQLAELNRFTQRTRLRHQLV